jgi:hypothetical protein
MTTRLTFDSGALIALRAALRGDVVYTSDVDDLTRLQTFFRGVRVLHT